MKDWKVANYKNGLGRWSYWKLGDKKYFTKNITVIDNSDNYVEILISLTVNKPIHI